MGENTKVLQAISTLRALTGRSDLTDLVKNTINFQKREIDYLRDEKRRLEQGFWHRFLKWFNGPKGGM